MNKRLKMGVVGMLAAGALAVTVAGTALAQTQEPTQTPPSSSAPARKAWGFGRGMGMGKEVTLNAAAESLNMTAEELSTQLWGGKTLADLAEEKGVALADVKAAVEAAQKAAAKDTIEQAVTAGTLTREQADWMLEGIDKGYMPHFGGFGGFGGGHRGRGHGGFNMRPGAPSQTPTTPSGTTSSGA